MNEWTFIRCFFGPDKCYNFQNFRVRERSKLWKGTKMKIMSAMKVMNARQSWAKLSDLILLSSPFFSEFLKSMLYCFLINLHTKKKSIHAQLHVFSPTFFQICLFSVCCVVLFYIDNFMRNFIYYTVYSAYNFL